MATPDSTTDPTTAVSDSDSGQEQAYTQPGAWSAYTEQLKGATGSLAPRGSPAQTPMIDPRTGTPGMVPNARVKDATAQGFKMGQIMLAPDGKTQGMIPLDQVQTAVGKGFSIAPPAGTPGMPQTPAHQAITARATRLEDKGQLPPGSLEAAVRDPVVSKMMSTTGAGVGAVLTGGEAAGAIKGAQEALPGVIAGTTAGVKALGRWADAHPFQAYLLYNTLREWVPGMKEAMGFIKKAPMPGE